MKKKKYVLMIITMSLSLVACGKVAKQTNNEAVIQFEEIQNSDNDVVNSIANPWITSDKQGVFDATGFTMDAPEGATDVNYSYMADGKLAQMTYVYEDADWVYRIQPTESLTDISGMNYTWVSDMPGKVSGMEAEYMGYSEHAEDSEYIDDMFFVQVVYWYDNIAGVTYSLSASGKNIDGMDIEVYAENLYSQVQSEIDGNTDTE